MTGRLTLICCGSTEANRFGAFARDEPLEPGAIERARMVASGLARADRVWRSPALRAVETAGALGLEGELREALRDQDFGQWAGRKLAEVEQGELATWMSDPDAAPHGGESLRDLRRRVSAFLAEALGMAGHTLAITHPPVIRAAVCEVLDAPPQGFWSVDVEPLGLTRFTSDGRRWALRLAALR